MVAVVVTVVVAVVVVVVATGALRSDEGEPWSALGVAEGDNRPRGDLDVVGTPAVREGPVVAAQVPHHPGRAVEGDGGVPPGDPGVVDGHVALRVPADGVAPPRFQGRAPSAELLHLKQHLPYLDGSVLEFSPCLTSVDCGDDDRPDSMVSKPWEALRHAAMKRERHSVSITRRGHIRYRMRDSYLFASEILGGTR